MRDFVSVWISRTWARKSNQIHSSFHSTNQEKPFNILKFVYEEIDSVLYLSASTINNKKLPPHELFKKSLSPLYNFKVKVVEHM